MWHAWMYIKSKTFRRLDACEHVPDTNQRLDKPKPPSLFVHRNLCSKQTSSSELTGSVRIFVFYDFMFLVIGLIVHLISINLFLRII